MPVAAHFGDRIIVRPLVSGTITFASFPLIVQRTRATHDVPAIFISSGNDTYEVTNDRLGALDITLQAMQPSISPLWIALLLFFATAFGILAALQLIAVPVSRLRVQLDLGSLFVFICSLIVFALSPHYFHNDEVGGGINWGYLGWGYVDTLRALPIAVQGGGIIGLAGVESLSKPILYPFLALPIATVTGALNAAIVVSVLCTALAALAVYRLGALLFDRWAGALAAALFIFSPLALAYASSFYLDIPYVAFACWSAVFLITALRDESKTALLIGILLGVIAVGVRNPIMAGLYFVSTVLLLLAAKITPLRAILTGLGSAVAAFFGAVFAWPFLWIDMAHRLPFVLVARLLFDQYYHLTQSIATRVGTMVTQTFIHTDPITILLLIVSIVAAALRRDIRILWLSGGVAAGRLFVAPTAFYLQHYWFYMAPFLQLIAGYAITVARLRFRVAIVAAASVLTFTWSALYFPYASAATLGCLSFRCSASRWGVDEPVYGLKEATAWIRANVARGTAIATLVAPHAVQFELPGYVVRSLFLPPDPHAQRELVSNIGARYILMNAWTRYRDHERVTMPAAHIVWQSAPREGMVSVFRVTDAPEKHAMLDAPPLSDLDLVPNTARRIVVYPRTFSYHMAPRGRQVVAVSEAVHPLTDFASLLRLGGGVALLTSTNVPPVFDYERPIARSSSGVALALPTLDGMQSLSSASLRSSTRTATTVVFSGDIVSRGVDRTATDIVGIRVQSTMPLAPTASIRMGVSCGPSSMKLHPIWIDRSDVRGYTGVNRPLISCIANGKPLATFVALQRHPHGTVRAVASLLWNGDNAKGQSVWRYRIQGRAASR